MGFGFLPHQTAAKPTTHSRLTHFVATQLLDIDTNTYSDIQRHKGLFQKLWADNSIQAVHKVWAEKETLLFFVLCLSVAL